MIWGLNSRPLETDEMLVPAGKKSTRLTSASRMSELESAVLPIRRARKHISSGRICEANVSL